MIGRTIATNIAAISLIVVALLTGSGNGSTMPVLAASTTVTFDDLAAGTAISNQYDSQGVDFQTGIIGSNVYCYPVVTQVPSSQAQSGNQVADTSCASGEFPDSSIHGTLKNATQTISVYAGHFSDPSSKGQSQQITLDAYDAGGTVLGSQTQTVTEGNGFHTLLHVDAGSASIVAFDVTSSYPHMGIDELTFTTPAPSGCAHVSTFEQLSDALNSGYVRLRRRQCQDRFYTSGREHRTAWLGNGLHPQGTAWRHDRKWTIPNRGRRAAVRNAQLPSLRSGHARARVQ